MGMCPGEAFRGDDLKDDVSLQHNPTGVDPSPQQWRDILRTVQQKRLLPFFDSAYQARRACCAPLMLHAKSLSAATCCPPATQLLGFPCPVLQPLLRPINEGVSAALTRQTHARRAS